MQDEVAALLSPPNNFCVVQLPGRKFPGIVVQGDSLAVIYKLARSIKRATEGMAGDLADDAAEIEVMLKERVRCCEEVLKTHGIPFPYFKNW